MVTTNIDVCGGIVNGAIGTIRSIHYITLDNGNRSLSYCVVHIPSATASLMLGYPHHEYPIIADHVYVTYKSPISHQAISFKQMQVPLIPAFAMTAHKSQGQTLNRAIIDLSSCRGTEAPYVLISCVRSLNDLLILRPFDLAKIRCRMSEDSRKEQDRIQYHHLATLLRYTTDSLERECAAYSLETLKRKYSQKALETLLQSNLADRPSLPDNHADTHLNKKRKTRHP